MKHDLGNRIKQYEDVYRYYLPNKLPIILRLDGKAWHTYLKKCQKPFDINVIECLNDTAIYLCQNMQGVKICYLQSDEMSFLIYNPDFESQGWFDNNLQKMISISASMASAYFTSVSPKIFGETRITQFDARCFIVPIDEVNNTFIFRQQDSTRNSIQSLARSLYSHKQCDNKNTSELQELCFQKGINWNDLPISQKRGRCIVKQKMMKTGFNKRTNEPFEVERSEWCVDNEIPIFSQDPNYINKYVFLENVSE